MKIMTLNTHSLQEVNYEQKLEYFLESVLKEKPDIIALQEVNQTCAAELIEETMLEGQFPIPGCRPVRKDNHAAAVASRLRAAGLNCYWAWLPIKLGYSKYDEGVAILSLGREIRAVDSFPISKVNDFQNWRTRAVLGVQVEGLEDWFYTAHMGWWDDASEAFLDQWKVLSSRLDPRRSNQRVWLVGDFNAPDAVSGQSYDHIRDCGWYDTYGLAASRDSGITVPGVIDGWRERLKGKKLDGMRLDYIWCSRECEVSKSRVVFNGQLEPVVSDHFGVMIEIGD